MKISDFRLSTLWVEACPELVGTDDHGRFGPVVRSDDYYKLFNTLLTADADPLVSVPWPRPRPGGLPARSEYWNDYVLREIRDHAKSNAGLTAWKVMVPLRRKAPLVRIEGSDRCFVEGWYWPHGIGVSVTLWSRNELSAEEFDKTIDHHLHKPLRIVWQDGQRAEIALNGLAAAALDKLRAEGFGGIAGGFRPQPMHVLTLVKAVKEAGDADPNAAWKTILERAVAAVGGDPNSPITPTRNIFTTSRGRVIWRPDRALTTAKTVHTMGCLHRNVTLGTLQVASMLRCAEMIGANAAAGLTPRVEPYARKMAGLLGRIFGGVETYSQKCLQEQVVLANAKGAIDGLRRALGLPPLIAEAKKADPKPAEPKQ